jgi:hypothetical protein
MVTGLKEFIVKNNIEIRKIGRLKFLVLYKAVRQDFGSWWWYIMKVPKDDTDAYRPGTTVKCREWSIDRNDDCGPGLHIGTWEYAYWFGIEMRIVEVLVRPKDVVCVPKPITKPTNKIRCNCLRVTREIYKPKRMV